MASIFSKPATELQYADIEELVGIAVEGQNLEFKARLPVEKGGEHPWMSYQSRAIDAFARDEILKEIAAFATAEGGCLVLGMAESNDGEHRAVRILDLPDCVLLADRFRQLAETHMEPYCFGIEWLGIRRGEESHEGVVIARVPSSRTAPHRLKSTREFYVRREAESVPMTVAEIRDVTLRSASREAELQRRLESRREQIIHHLKGYATQPAIRTCFRVTALPLERGKEIRRIYAADSVFCSVRDFQGEVDGCAVLMAIPSTLKDISLVSPKPMLRGARRQTESGGRLLIVEAYSDGMIEWFLSRTVEDDRNREIYVGWVMAAVANALLMANNARQAADIPGSEIVLEIEFGISRGNLMLRDFEEERYQGVGEIRRGSLTDHLLLLPAYSVASTKDFQILMLTILNDLRETAGFHAVESLSMDFG